MLMTGYWSDDGGGQREHDNLTVRLFESGFCAVKFDFMIFVSNLFILVFLFQRMGFCCFYFSGGPSLFLDYFMCGCSAFGCLQGG